MSEFTHFDEHGNAVMVDVSEKELTHRTAVAEGKIRVNEEIFQAIQSGTVTKGDVLGVARVAGIMAAKQTSSAIPMCHPLLLTKCCVDFELLEETCEVKATSLVKVKGQTGVEMEALHAVSVALLTIYDMCKALGKDMEITGIQLVRKHGGKSGDYYNHRLEHEANI